MPSKRFLLLVARARLVSGTQRIPDGTEMVSLIGLLICRRLELWSFGFPPLLWFLKLDISQKLKPIMVSGAAQYLFVIGRVGLMVALDGEPVAFV